MKMTAKTVKNKRPAKTPENAKRRSAQILFVLFAIILILSMVLSAVTTY
jgi:hypothetical protein